MRSEHQRIADAIAEAAAPKAPATTRDDVLAYLAERFDFIPEECAQITGATMGEMAREARALARNRAAAPTVEEEPTPATYPAFQPALVSGHGVPDYEPTFDADALARQVRKG